MRRGTFILALALLAAVAWPGASFARWTADAYPNFRLPKGPTYICGEYVPTEIPDVRERLDREFIVNVYDRAQVIMWIKRSGRYFPLIQKLLAEEEMPDDLKYVAIIESNLKVHAYSSAGAAGVWQFIRPTGRKYGLRRYRHLDERLKVKKATNSALSYLKKLYEQFGTWTLAMAAYNCGEARVAKEIEEQGVKSYFTLDLPSETERYVFRAIAAKIILENQTRYGYHVRSEERYKPLEIDEVSLRVKGVVPIKYLAEATGTYFKHFRDLNPHLRGSYLFPGTYQLNVPAGKGGALLKRMEEYFKGRTRWASRFTYKVRKGDSLSVIARKFRVSVRDLKAWNRLRHTTVYPGQVLHIYPRLKGR